MPGMVRFSRTITPPLALTLAMQASRFSTSMVLMVPLKISASLHQAAVGARGALIASDDLPVIERTIPFLDLPAEDGVIEGGCFFNIAGCQLEICEAIHGIIS